MSRPISRLDHWYKAETPRYLLPEGCNDLIDALRLAEAEERRKKFDALPWKTPTKEQLRASELRTSAITAMIQVWRTSALKMKPVQNHSLFKDFRKVMELARKIGKEPCSYCGEKSASLTPFATGVWRFWCERCQRDLEKFAKTPGNETPPLIADGSPGREEYLLRIEQLMQQEDEFMRKAVKRRRKKSDSAKGAP